MLQLGIGSALLAALGYLGVNIFIGNVIEPRIMGKDLGLSPLVVFLSLVFWGWVLGPEAPIAGGLQASEQDPEREAASGKFIGNSCMMKRSLAIPSEGGKA